MGRELKPIGKAVATARGHYPGADGRHRTVQPGEHFTVFEGMDKAKWFTVLGHDAPVPSPTKPQPDPVPDTLHAVAQVESRRRIAVRAPTSVT